MNCFTLQCDTPSHAAAARPQRLQQRVLDRFASKTVMGAYPIHIPLLHLDAAHIGCAKPRRQFDQRIEHGLQIEGRAADDLEHVGGGGLLLQRFASAPRALLHLVEQPRVLDGDHRLVGEGLTSSICLSVKGRTSSRPVR